MTLALVIQLFADAVVLEGPVGWLARSGVALAAILMPTGFFLSSMAPGPPARIGLSVSSCLAPCSSAWEPRASGSPC